MSQEEPIIRVENLTAGYGERIVLEEVSFQVRSGEILAILGPSGSGKSTLLKHLIGLNPPLGGEVWIEGKNLVTTKGTERQQLLRTFGVLYQGSAMFGSMTVADNIRLSLNQFTDLPEVAKDLVALSKLRLVGLSGAADKMPSELSGGMLKRAALARAMALDPCILFLDEPSVGLDPISSAGLDELILQLSQGLGITFVIITHEMPSIYRVATRALMVDDRTKRIIAEGKPSELRDHSDNPLVRAFFHRQTRGAGAMRQTATQ